MRFKKRGRKKAEGFLSFVSLGGVAEVNKNMHLYEYSDEVLVVDCGIDFPDSETPGVDVVIPDFSYLVKGSKRLRGVIVTHGHEDHFGALPYFLSQVSVPVYATKLVRGFIAAKLAEFNLEKKVDLRLLDPEKGELVLGPFKVTPFRVNHSVPDSVGLCLATPAGKVFHVADYKFDWTPVMDKPFALARLIECAQGEVLALASDCLGATSEGYTRSERRIEEVFDQLISRAKGQVFVTTISSNISRIQQAVNVSLRYGRRVCFLGRSIEKNTEVARGLGFLRVAKKNVLSPPAALDLPPSAVVYIAAGCYGQPDSALSRVGRGEHRFISLKTGATVIFSADPSPPGAKDHVDSLVDRLTSLGADVYYYDIQEDLHTSGHGSRQELAMLAALVRPKYFVPIGGTNRHMHAYAQMIEEMGFPKESVLLLEPGRRLSLAGGRAKLGEQLTLSGVYIDGAGVGDIGGQVLRERQIMANDGLILVGLPLKEGRSFGRVKIDSRGFTKGDPFLFSQLERLVGEVVGGDLFLEGKNSRHLLVRRIKREIRRFVLKKVDRRPLIVVNLLEV